METESKRGRGKATRGNRGRPRGRGKGRGKKLEKVVSSDEEIDSVADLGKENDCENDVLITSTMNIPTENENTVIEEEQQPMLVASAPMEQPAQAIPAPILPPTIDMEADISQLEAPTFTTLSRGPPEPMLRLKWNHKVNLIGEKVLNPMIHCCDQCDKPILIYGRMIPCKHIFCLKCARTEPIKICPRCNDKVLRVEQSGLGAVFLCTHGGSRYGNTGCRRTYLSQRDLQAHINHRHVSQIPAGVAIQQQNPLTLPPPVVDTKPDTHLDPHKLAGSTRKLSESSTGATLQSPSALLNQRTIQMRTTSTGIGSIPPPGTANIAATQAAAHSHSALTAANLARINNANAQDCHQGKERLHQTLKKAPITQSHHHQPSETVADASYYSSVLNSFGAGEGTTERSVRKY